MPPQSQGSSSTQSTLLDSYDDCINVIIDNCRREQPADATYRPDLPPEPTYGMHFEPLEMPYREPQFLPLPPTALQLFQTFLPEPLVARWVDYTNKAAEIADLQYWSPVSSSEIYIWLAILIYMEMHKESCFRDYWKAPTAQGFDPTQPITKLMPRTNIAVDEKMVAFTGMGYSIAQQGYFLGWVCHRPHSKFGPVGKPSWASRAPRGSKKLALNPTQSVVPFLLHKLPDASYHVFLDNPFSSSKLFTALRDEGHGATGTARINCGIFKQLVEAKIRDNKGQCWRWNELRAYATVDNKVSCL
ncbi:hypothetical protein S40285_09092 [Stachybotrys chlorohalonatus IBT 40285]|uniref:PiggyBac transposable element-derived protein domain-containing protein n=1 Tax=Stachybotrys chlorohalonatus (strain IBT 40285) TaxID=1283841 RepID=A0A084R2G5_STAC4|nr:hypothetical protein S40285_09092 [Stachybotrys chlorohalonata IBT 40285]